MMRFKYFFSYLVFVFFFGALGVARANTFTVIATTDTNCSDGTCDLPTALASAQLNADPAGNTLNLMPGTYSACTDGTYTYTAVTNAPLTIQNAQAVLPVLDGQGCFNQIMNIDTTGISDDLAQIAIRGMIFQNATFDGNGAGLDIETDQANIVLQGSTFSNNTSTSGQGGGLFTDQDSGSATLNGNLFLGNKAVEGAGLDLDTIFGTLTITNNIVANNIANGDNGGGAEFEMANIGSSLVLTNNTIFNNTTDEQGGGVALDIGNTDSISNIFNNIIFGNTAGAEGADIFAGDDGSGHLSTGAVINLFNNDLTSFFSSCANSGGSCTPQVTEGNNLNVDPLFVDSANDDFNLQSTSPVIDKGDLNPPGGLPDPDFNGDPRPSGPLPDMGALEFQVPPPPVPPLITDLSGSGCLGSLTGAPAPVDFAYLFWAAMPVLSLVGLRLQRRS